MVQGKVTFLIKLNYATTRERKRERTTQCFGPKIMPRVRDPNFYSSDDVRSPSSPPMYPPEAPEKIAPPRSPFPNHPPPAPVGTPAPPISLNEAFVFISFALVSIFVILYSVYLSLIVSDDDLDDLEGDEDRYSENNRRTESTRLMRTANVDDGDDDSSSNEEESSSRTNVLVLKKFAEELQQTWTYGNERVKRSVKLYSGRWTKKGEAREDRTIKERGYLEKIFGRNHSKKSSSSNRNNHHSEMGNAFLDGLLSDDDEDEESLLSVNEDDFFDEDVMEDDEEKMMWAPYTNTTNNNNNNSNTQHDIL
jgi:hypothetical protein